MVIRQKIRKTAILISFILFPVTFYYFSPYLIIDGASQGIISGSFLTFGTLFVISLVIGRAFCGWACPAAGLQEACFKVNNQNFRAGKRDWVKYFIWVPWLSIIALMFIRAGRVKAVHPFYQTYYGISVSNIPALILFLIIASLIAIIAIIAGKRGFCHYACWMAPFMILGRKIQQSAKWPALRLQATKDKCINCKTCSKNCPMSLDVNDMVARESMENTECILCGTCVDNCPNGVIKYSL